ncbi:hypothetical protein BD408DRAFT_413669 [Parasitella parasitica]|nr:hypothetical protein BD408DRAFT_413669 [Parasitella parasitica]
MLISTHLFDSFILHLFTRLILVKKKTHLHYLYPSSIIYVYFLFFFISSFIYL